MRNTVPDSGEYAPFYAGYVARVPETDLESVLENQAGELARLAKSVADEHFRYAPGKWTLREMFGHLCDAERVFGYRLFCISRGETQSLPGFDENSYVESASYDLVSLSDHVKQFSLLRDANLMVWSQLTEQQVTAFGTANKHTISVRALARIMAGHVRHHIAVLNERYKEAFTPLR
jgi:hypothetical protein